MKDWVLEVWGDYACFTRPEMKVERVSYDVITPSAARAIYEAIFWKPAIRWHITEIEVLNPIRTASIRRNEVGKVISSPSRLQMDGSYHLPMGFCVEDERQQRASLVLRDVHYRLHAWFEYVGQSDRREADIKPDESPAKYAAMFERRAKHGQCFHRPYLGCREFACFFKLVDPASNALPPPLQEDTSFGWMFYDMDFSDTADIRPLFFHAVMKNGVVNTDRRMVEVLA